MRPEHPDHPPGRRPTGSAAAVPLVHRRGDLPDHGAARDRRADCDPVVREPVALSGPGTGADLPTGATVRMIPRVSVVTDAATAPGRETVSSLNGRVRALERQRRLAAGCRSCGGQGVHILEDAEAAPIWLDASSRCPGRGQGVKLCSHDTWDLL